MVLNDLHRDRLLSHYGIDLNHPAIKQMVDGDMLASVDQAKARDLLDQDVPSGGILIRYPGSENFTIRLDQAKKGDDGRERKYLRPIGAKNELYTPPGTDILKSNEIWVTEGELKALRSSIDGLPVVALSGIWNWRDGQAKDDLAGLIADLDCDWNGKSFVLIYDSDIKTTHPAYPAFQRLADVLYAHGARRVKVITLPEIKDLKKAGIDDFLNKLNGAAVSKIESLIKISPYIVPGALGHQRFIDELKKRNENDPELSIDIELATKALILAGKEADARGLLSSFHLNTDRQRAYISDAKHYAKSRKSDEEKDITASISQNLKYGLFRDQVNREIIKVWFEDEKGISKAEYVYSDSSRFTKWIVDQIEKSYGKTPDKSLIDRIKSSITAQFLYSQREVIVSHRFLKVDETIFYSLNDKSNHILQITAKGVEILSSDADKTVVFINPPQSLAQPMPDLSTPPSGLDLLFSEGLVNITDPEDQMMYKVILAASLASDGPRHIICFHGEAGAGKSSAADLIKRLLDPEKALRQKMPSSQDGRKSLFNNRDVVLLDNLTNAPEWMLNDLCLASTGGHDVDRKLYTDSDEVLIDLHKLVIITGINPIGSWRSDFIERCVVFQLKRIGVVVDETAIWQRFEELRPKIFGALINTVKEALKILPEISKTNLTRISTGSRFGEACARAMGYKPNEFMNALKNRQKSAKIQMAYTDSVSKALLLFMEGVDSFKGTYSDLHRELGYMVCDEERRMRSWPKNGAALSRKVNTIKDVLQTAGLQISEDRDQRRGIIITKTGLPENADASAAPQRESQVESCQETAMSVGDVSSNAMDGITEIADCNNQGAPSPSDALDAKTVFSLPYRENFVEGNNNSIIKSANIASSRPRRPIQPEHIDSSMKSSKTMSSNCVLNGSSIGARCKQIGISAIAGSSAGELGDIKGDNAGSVNSDGKTPITLESRRAGGLDSCAACGNEFPAHLASFFHGFKGPVCRKCSVRLNTDKSAKKSHPRDDAEMLFYYRWLKRLSNEESDKLLREFESKANASALSFKEAIHSESC